jgi:hypothetical protein
MPDGFRKGSKMSLQYVCVDHELSEHVRVGVTQDGRILFQIAVREAPGCEGEITVLLPMEETLAAIQKCAKVGRETWPKRR